MRKIFKEPKDMTESEWKRYLANLQKQNKIYNEKAAEKRKLKRHIQKIKDRIESAHKRRRLGLIESQVYLDLLKELTAHERALLSRLNSLG